ncbi:hypothetical protein HDU86_003273 [Geranomyces michiganensis]|nr:hypothetical protein HDU86_003273 [Geranomyces michiganensis]
MKGRILMEHQNGISVEIEQRRIIAAAAARFNRYAGLHPRGGSTNLREPVSLFDIDGIVEGYWEGQGIVVIISAKSYVEARDVETLQSHLTIIQKYIDLLAEGGGYALQNRNVRFKEQDRTFDAFAESKIQPRR